MRIVQALIFTFVLASFYGQTQITMNETVRFDDTYDTLFYRKGKSLSKLDSFDVQYETPRFTLENMAREALPIEGMTIGASHHNNLWNYKTPKNYFAPMPYFRFFYSIGSNSEQNMSLIFAQNVRKGFGYQITYNRTVGTSFQRRLATKLNKMHVALYYKNASYHVKLAAQMQDIRLAESGGIGSDSLLLLNGVENIAIEKDIAERRMKGISTSLMNRVNFSRDSLSTIKHGFFMRNILNIDYMTYSEVGDINSMYPNVFIDSLTTADKYHYSGINNHLGYYLKSRLFEVELGYGFDYYEKKNFGNESYRDHYFNSSVALSKWRKFSFNNDFDIYFKGRKQGDINERFVASYVDSSWSVHVKSNFKIAEPTLRQEAYRGNNFEYSHDFDKMTQLEIGASGNYKNRFMTLGVQAHFQGNSKPVYWDSISYKQLSGAANYLKIGLTSQFKFWKMFNELTINYRYSSNDVIRVPALEINDRIYFKAPVFKSKKLVFMTGIGIRYYTGYKGYGFTPSMSEFYLSNQSVQNYPNLDFFLGLNITKVNFYFKIENWNASFHKTSHFVAEGYPVRPAYFKLGLQWEFFN